MSVRVMADVWDAGPEDAVDSSVLVALANHCDDDGRSCFPSVERVARMVRRSQRTVERSIAALEAGGWIQVERGGGRGVFSSYTINVEMLLKRRQTVAVSTTDKRRQPRQETATATTEKATATPSYKEEPSCNHQENQDPPLPPASGGTQGDGGVELPAMSREEFLADLAEVNALSGQRRGDSPFREDEWRGIVAESHRAAARKATAAQEAAQWEPRRTKAGRLRWRRRGS